MDLTVEYVVTHVQGFKWNFDLFFLFFEKLSNMKEPGLTCGSLTWLMYKKMLVKTHIFHV